MALSPSYNNFTGPLDPYELIALHSASNSLDLKREIEIIQLQRKFSREFPGKKSPNYKNKIALLISKIESLKAICRDFTAMNTLANRYISFGCTGIALCFMSEFSQRLYDYKVHRIPEPVSFAIPETNVKGPLVPTKIPEPKSSHSSDHPNMAYKRSPLLSGLTTPAKEEMPLHKKPRESSDISPQNPAPVVEAETLATLFDAPLLLTSASAGSCVQAKPLNTPAQPDINPNDIQKLNATLFDELIGGTVQPHTESTG